MLFQEEAMKKKILRGSVLLICIFLLFAGTVLYIPKSGRNACSLTKKIYSNIVIRQLEENIDFTGEDLVTFQDGRFCSFEIGSHESAEVLYTCIRSAAKLGDYTNACLAPQEIPILVNSACSGTFGMIYYPLPTSGRLIGFQFTEENTEHFRAYIASIVDEKVQSNSVVYIN